MDTLELRLKQMHAALRKVISDDFSAVQPRFLKSPDTLVVIHDYNAHSDPIELANDATLIINNIARLKDHLKTWCHHNGTRVRGESLINNNLSVALIHDLWNTEKHAELNRLPRSGHKPRLIDLRTGLRLSARGEGKSSIAVTIDLETGKQRFLSNGGGKAELVLDGKIVDENDVLLATFAETCEKAVEAWYVEYKGAGVPIPPS